jgi:hypothetical protein
MMNSPLVVEIARRMLTRSEVAAEATLDGKVRLMYRLCLAREAADDELQAARDFLGEAPAPQRWHSYAQALLLTNEFWMVD